MFTLKIRWYSFEQTAGAPRSQVDESTIFVAGDRIEVHGWTDGANHDEVFSSWARVPDGSNGLNDHLWSTLQPPDGGGGGLTYDGGRLVRVDRDGVASWYLCSQAWVLGEHGQTIERCV